jgi:hypothetical protein
MRASAIFIVVLSIAYALLQFREAAKSANALRHLTDEYHYAHFSPITTHNKHLFPEHWLAKRSTFVLKSGQALWIPKGWWHWVLTTKPTIATNFWSRKCLQHHQNTEPRVIENPVQSNLQQVKDAISKHWSACHTWDSSKDTFSQNQNHGRDNTCIITLGGYEKNINGKMNKELHRTLKALVPVPADVFSCPEDVDQNFWLTRGKHDTGLHYDDYDGLLCVLEGEKHVTLFAPDQSKYLLPHIVLPSWCQPKFAIPKVFEYNIHAYIRDAVSPTLPSSRLLYESIKNANHSKEILATVGKVVRAAGLDETVWGCKLHNGVLRWELYSYYYDSYNRKYAPDRNVHGGLKSIGLGTLHIMRALLLQKSTIIHSFDLYDSERVVGSSVHAYHAGQPRLELPFFGRTHELSPSPKTETALESLYFVACANDAMAHYDEYMKRIEFDPDVSTKFLSRLHDYSCKNICIHKKILSPTKTDFFIQYLGISVHDFLKFLNLFQYPDALIQHVIANVQKYEELVHEITIVYDAVTCMPIRSGFYGIV